MKTRVQFCDLRFYYDSAASPAPFTEDQLVQLRKSSLARVKKLKSNPNYEIKVKLKMTCEPQVTCDNGDNIKSMQPLAFRTTSKM